jgi:hypothetical protein
LLATRSRVAVACVLQVVVEARGGRDAVVGTNHELDLLLVATPPRCKFEPVARRRVGVGDDAQRFDGDDDEIALGDGWWQRAPHEAEHGRSLYKRRRSAAQVFTRAAVALGVVVFAAVVVVGVFEREREVSGRGVETAKDVVIKDLAARLVKLACD